MIENIQTMEELQEIFVKKDYKYYFIDFFTDWCGPCKMIAPYFKSLSTEYSDILFIKINADEAEDLVSYFQVQGLPTFLLIDHDTKIMEKVVGANQQKIKSVLDQTLFQSKNIFDTSDITYTM